MARDDDDDFLEGESLDFTEDETTDEELPYEVLFASVIEQHGLFGRLKRHHAIEERADEWRELFANAEIGEPT